MALVYILIFLSLISHGLSVSVVDILIDIFYPFHLRCLQSVPDHIRSVESLQALVCGKNITDPRQAELLIATGLIHLFVVSGSHLLLLQKYLQKLCNVKILILIALFFYCAICKFNPPIFRSFILLMLVFVTDSIALELKSENLVLISGMLCLILSPAWSNSLSLQMSWIAALTLVIISKFFAHRSTVFKNSLFYLHYLTTFYFIGIPSPVSIGISALLTPFLEYILFPLALAVYVAPFLGQTFDFILEKLNLILSQLEMSVVFRPYDSEKVIILNWILICALHFFLSQTRKVAYAN